MDVGSSSWQTPCWRWPRPVGESMLVSSWRQLEKRRTSCLVSSILSPAASLAADARSPMDAELSFAVSSNTVRWPTNLTSKLTDPCWPPWRQWHRCPGRSQRRSWLLACSMISNNASEQELREHKLEGIHCECRLVICYWCCRRGLSKSLVIFVDECKWDDCDLEKDNLVV